jgi:hypothetical protein
MKSKNRMGIVDKARKILEGNKNKNVIDTTIEEIQFCGDKHLIFTCNKPLGHSDRHEQGNVQWPIVP